jgi:hypothetical protein
MIPSPVVAFFLALIMGLMWNQVMQSCIAHHCWFEPYL